MTRIRVNIPHHPYEIIIQRGSLGEVGSWLSQLWSAKRVAIITDDRVADLYLTQVTESLMVSDFDVSAFSFPAGEAQKNLDTVQAIYGFLMAEGMTRSDGILALGGGVVGDLAGFVASTYLRGLPFVQVPTSLTAQVDAAIGGKTGVNTTLAKNMIGTFAQPDGVLIDPEVLESLGRRGLIEGMGEVIKYGLVADRALWQLLTELDGSPEAILAHSERLISHSCRVKANLVAGDEHDHGQRLLLNFGHTIGHAVEVATGYGHIMHGEAVAIGMVQISRVAERLGLIRTGLAAEIATMCAKFGLPIHHEPWEVDRLYEAMVLDKKARGKLLNLVLVAEVGRSFLHQVSLAEAKVFLEKI